MFKRTTYISIKDLRFQRGNKRIYNGLNIDFPKGKITAIMGPSGTGKTTLLKLIGGQLQPNSGSVSLDGENLSTLSTKKLLHLRQKKIGMLFQSGALFTDLNVFENVAFPLREHTQLSDTMIRDLVLMKLESVGLRGAADMEVSQLSGGMARRVALARSIAMDPELMMYDEPFTGLDPIAMGVVARLISNLSDSLGLTSLLVTHDLEVCEIADYICILSGGKVLAMGTPQELKRSKSQEVAQFLNGLPDGPVPFHYPADDFSTQMLDVSP